MQYLGYKNLVAAVLGYTASSHLSVTMAKGRSKSQNEANIPSPSNPCSASFHLGFH